MDVLKADNHRQISWQNKLLDCQTNLTVDIAVSRGLIRNGIFTVYNGIVDQKNKSISVANLRITPTAHVGIAQLINLKEQIRVGHVDIVVQNTFKSTYRVFIVEFGGVSPFRTRKQCIFPANVSILFLASPGHLVVDIVEVNQVWSCTQGRGEGLDSKNSEKEEIQYRGEKRETKLESE